MSEKAERECFADCLHLALVNVGKKKYDLAAAHMDNAVRSLMALAELQKIEEENKYEIKLTGNILNRRNFDRHN